MLVNAKHGAGVTAADIEEPIRTEGEARGVQNVGGERFDFTRRGNTVNGDGYLLTFGTADGGVDRASPIDDWIGHRMEILCQNRRGGKRHRITAAATLLKLNHIRTRGWRDGTQYEGRRGQ